ncbi:sigma-70 family RNA polymerase sigma factor [Leptolyngbyaceae cyanobacterium UHCC 1019]
MHEIDFNQLDHQLAELAEQAKQAGSSLERQRSLHRLIHLLSQPRVLYPPQLNRHPPEAHRDLYNETCQRVWLYVCRNIERYDPQKASVRKWVNYLLDKRFIDVVKERNGKRTTYLSDLSELERRLEERRRDQQMIEEEASEVQSLRDFLEQDLLFRKHIKGHPEASFQAIALRILAGKTWEEISKEFGIPVSSLSSFYQRCLKKFLPFLQQRLSH